MAERDQYGDLGAIRCHRCGGRGVNPDPRGTPDCPSCDGCGWIDAAAQARLSAQKQLRQVINESKDAGDLSRPHWLPRLGRSVVLVSGKYREADHLGPIACMALRAGDLIGLELNDAGEIDYAEVLRIHSLPDARRLLLDTGHGQEETIVLPMMRLLSSVWRPVPVNPFTRQSAPSS